MGKLGIALADDLLRQSTVLPDSSSVCTTGVGEYDENYIRVPVSQGSELRLVALQGGIFKRTSQVFTSFYPNLARNFEWLS